MGRPSSLVAAVRATEAGAFVADTAPVIYRIERGADPSLVAACDPLFDAVEAGEVGCLVSAGTFAGLLVEPLRVSGAAVAVVDGFLRQPMIGIAELDETIAREAAELVARDRVGRLPDALIAATAARFGLPLVTGDRRLARAGAAEAFLVADYA